MENKEFIVLCKKHVMDYFNENADKTDQKRICEDDVLLSGPARLSRIIRRCSALPFRMVCTTS